MENRLIDIHSHSPNPKDNVFSVQNLIVNQPFQILPNQFYSIGLHPWYLEMGLIENHLLDLEMNLQKANIIALGEIGLDKLCKTNFEFQIKVFEKQIDLAHQYNMPIIIHCVKAFSELISIVKRKHTKVPIVIHGFNQNKQILEQLLKNNFYISIGVAILNEKSNVNKCISMIPLDRLFLETDNRDIQIEEIYLKVCQVRNITLPALTETLNSNFLKLFDFNVII